MRRFRVLSFDFDATPNLLNIEVREDWDDGVKELHEQNRQRILAGLQSELGLANFDSKLQNFMDLGAKSPSIIAFHNKFHAQIRNAFVVGAYYPALTGACALGERILNHMLLSLRKEFRTTPEYKKVYRQKSFDNWDVPIDTLESWQILIPGVAGKFRNLARLRVQSIHFDPEIDRNDRPRALEAVKLIDEIISTQFTSLGTSPWFISGISGESYVRKESEPQPFIKVAYLPNCALVGPEHRIEFREGAFVVHDRHDYDDHEITDDKFRDLRNKFKSGG